MTYEIEHETWKDREIFTARATDTGEVLASGIFYTAQRTARIWDQAAIQRGLRDQARSAAPPLRHGRRQRARQRQPGRQRGDPDPESLTHDASPAPELMKGTPRADRARQLSDGALARRDRTPHAERIRRHL